MAITPDTIQPDAPETGGIKPDAPIGGTIQPDAPVSAIKPDMPTEEPVGGAVGHRLGIIPKEVSEKEHSMWIGQPGAFKGEQFDLSTPAGRYLHWKHNVAPMGPSFTNPKDFLTAEDENFGRNAEEAAKESRWNIIGGAERGLGAIGQGGIEVGALLNRPMPWGKDTAQFVKSEGAGIEGAERTSKYGLGTVANAAVQAVPFAAGEGPVGTVGQAIKAAPQGLAKSALLMGAPAAEKTLEQGGAAGEAAVSGTVNTALGGVMPVVGAGAGQLARGGWQRFIAPTAAGQAVKRVVDYAGRSVQDVLNDHPGLLKTVQDLTGKAGQKQILADRIAELEKAGADKPLLDRINQGRMNPDDMKTVVDLVRGDPAKAKDIAALSIVEGNRQKMNEQMQTFANAAYDELSKKPGYMPEQDIKDTIGQSKWDDIKATWLNSRKGALEKIAADREMPEAAKAGLSALLETHGKITDQALKFAQDNGFSNYVEGGDYMHRLLTEDAAKGKGLLSSFDEDRTLDPLSQAHQQRTEVVDKSNVNNYADPEEALKHFLGNYADTLGKGSQGAEAYAKALGEVSGKINQHLGALQEQARRMAADASEAAPEGLSEQAAAEAAGRPVQPPEATQQALHENAQAQKDLQDLIDQMNRTPNIPMKGKGASLALKQQFANGLQAQGYAPADIARLTSVAGSYIDRTMDAQRAGAVLNAMRIAQNLRNSLNPAAALAPLMDPITILSSGNLDTTIGALQRVMQKEWGISGALETFKGPIVGGAKAIASVAKGNPKQALSMTYDALTAISSDLHSGMQKVSQESSLRDLALARPNAAKFRKGMGPAVYDAAEREAQDVLQNRITPRESLEEFLSKKQQELESSPIFQSLTPKQRAKQSLNSASMWTKQYKEASQTKNLDRVLPLLMNEKLPMDMMGQSALWNKITQSSAGRALVMNSSFAASKLNNTIRLALTAARSPDEQTRTHATVALAQLVALSAVVEHAFFGEIQQASSNSLAPRPEDTSVAGRVGDVLPLTRAYHTTPPVVKDVGTLVNQSEAMTKPGGMVSWKSSHVVPPPAATVSGFIPMGVKAAKKIGQWVHQ